MEESLRGALEVIPGRVFYVVLKAIPHPRNEVVWVDAETPYHYWPFFEDYGPVSLGNLHRFCAVMNGALRDRAAQGRRIVVFSGPHGHKRANAVFLLASWSLLFQGRTPDEAYRPFARIRPPLAPWHDATPHRDDFNLTTLDVLRGLAKARDCGFLVPFEQFNLAEYEHYEKVENGDMNWIVDGRFLAFAGPHETRACTPEGYVATAVDDLVPHFKRKGVAAVVRLNKKYYNEARFKDAAIAHYDMYYLDGSNPPEPILQRFLAVCEATPGAIAVHCKAGLGRTGTCIGAYLMKHYRVTAREIIGWMRVCRPGTVIGPQQDFLVSIEGRMWQDGEAFRRIRSLPAAVAGCALDTMDRERSAIAAAAAVAYIASSAATTPVAPRGAATRASAQHHPGEDSSVRLIGGLTLSNAGTPAGAPRRGVDVGGALPVCAGSSGLAGPASSTPVAKPATRQSPGASAAGAVAASGPPRVNVAAGPSAVSPAASSPAARGSASTLRSPSRLLQLFGSGAGSASGGSPAAAQTAADRAYGAPRLPDVAAPAGSGAEASPGSGRRQGGSPSGFAAFLSSITSRSSGSSSPREAAPAPASAAGGAGAYVAAATPSSPSSMASTATTSDAASVHGFSAASHHASASSNVSGGSGFSIGSAGDHSVAAAMQVHAGMSAPSPYSAPVASPGSSPAATGYLTRSRLRVGEAGAATTPASPPASSAAAAGGRSQSMGQLTPPRSSAAASAHAAAGHVTPAHTLGSQGDMLRSAKSASRIQAASPHALSPAASGASAGHPSSLNLRSAGGAALLHPVATVGGVPPKNSNFHVHLGGAGGAAGTPPSSGLFGSSRLLGRYR